MLWWFNNIKVLEINAFHEILFKKSHNLELHFSSGNVNWWWKTGTLKCKLNLVKKKKKKQEQKFPSWYGRLYTYPDLESKDVWAPRKNTPTRKGAWWLTGLKKAAAEEENKKPASQWFLTGPLRQASFGEKPVQNPPPAPTCLLPLNQPSYWSARILLQPSDWELPSNQSCVLTNPNNITFWTNQTVRT